MPCNIFERIWYTEFILEQFFLTVDQNNFGSKIQFLHFTKYFGQVMTRKMKCI